MGDASNSIIDRVKLRDLLLKHAVSEDLRAFCFELDETYENIVGPNDKLNAAIINVISYFDNRGRAGELLDRARIAFPNVKWEAVFVSSATTTGIGEVTMPLVTASGTGTFSRRPGPLRVFLCHASDDKLAVRELYGQIKGAGFAPWLDEEDLRPGQKWRAEIPKAIERSDVILVCLSQKSANREGYVKLEIEFALDIAEKQPDDAIFVIPVRLEACEFPERVGDFHGVDLFDPRGSERLTRALHARAGALGAEATPQSTADQPAPTEQRAEASLQPTADRPAPIEQTQRNRTWRTIAVIAAAALLLAAVIYIAFIAPARAPSAAPTQRATVVAERPIEAAPSSAITPEPALPVLAAISDASETCPGRLESGPDPTTITRRRLVVAAGSVAYLHGDDVSLEGRDPLTSTLVSIYGPYDGAAAVRNGVLCAPLPADSPLAAETYAELQAECDGCGAAEIRSTEEKP